MKKRYWSLCVAAIMGCVQACAWGTSSPTIHERMSSIYSRPASNTTFIAALREIEQLTGVTVSVDWQWATSAGVGKDRHLSLEAVEARGDQLLDQVLARVSTIKTPLTWRIREHDIEITTLAQARQFKTDANTNPKHRPTEPRPRVHDRVSFQATPLHDVLSYLNSIAKVDIVTNWRALEASGVYPDTRITLEASNVSPAKILDLITEQLSTGKNKFDSVYWMVDEGMVLFTTGQVLNDRTTTRVYDISDLLVSTPDYRGPRIDASVQAENSSGSNGSSRQSGLFASDRDDEDESDGICLNKQEIGENLIDIVKLSIGEDMWHPQGKGAIRIFKNQLVISQTRLGFLLLQRSSR